MFCKRNAQCTVHPINAYVRSLLHNYIHIYKHSIEMQLLNTNWIGIESNWIEWNGMSKYAMRYIACNQPVCSVYSVHDVNSLISKRVIRTLLYRIRRERNFNCESLLRATYSRESSWINSHSNFNERIYKMRWWLRQQMLYCNNISRAAAAAAALYLSAS